MTPLDRIDQLDQVTRITDRATGMLLLKDPVRTSLGLVLGSVLWFLTMLLEPTLQEVTFADFAAVPGWGWLACGVLVMHIPTIGSLFKRPSVGNQTMDTIFASIERGDFSPVERRQLYRRLIERFADVAVASSAPTNQRSDYQEGE